MINRIFKWNKKNNKLKLRLRYLKLFDKTTGFSKHRNSITVCMFLNLNRSILGFLFDKKYHVKQINFLENNRKVFYKKRDAQKAKTI